MNLPENVKQSLAQAGDVACTPISTVHGPQMILKVHKKQSEQFRGKRNIAFSPAFYPSAHGSIIAFGIAIHGRDNVWFSAEGYFNVSRTEEHRMLIEQSQLPLVTVNIYDNKMRYQFSKGIKYIHGHEIATLAQQAITHNMTVSNHKYELATADFQKNVPVDWMIPKQ